MNKKIIFAQFFSLFVALFLLRPVSAFEIEKLTNTPVSGDFVIGPGKTEIQLDAGDKITKGLTVTNRYGQTMNFKLEIEDFSGSNNPDEALILLGGEKGPYSLRDFIYPEILSFKLNHGERITIPISFDIPKDAQPGGLYGSVIVTTEPVPYDNNDKTEKGNISIVSRMASLFFVRISGDVYESGNLSSFAADKKYYGEADINFKFLYKNDGNVYLNPYGLLEVKNILGTTIEKAPIQPYFVMPQSTRQREVNVNRSLMFGYYSAVLQINRGYGDIIDSSSVNFWVLPWKQVVLAIIVILAIVIICKLAWSLFTNNFEIKRKE